MRFWDGVIGVLLMVMLYTNMYAGNSSNTKLVAKNSGDSTTNSTVETENTIDGKNSQDSHDTQSLEKPRDSKNTVTHNNTSESFIDSMLYTIFRYKKSVMPKCDEMYQQEVCTGDMMCYATKCFYQDVSTEILYSMLMKTLVATLQEQDGIKYEKEIQHLQQIMDFGLPKDKKRHDFRFINSNNQQCTYWLWQKNDITLEVNLTGCLTHAEVMYTFIEQKISDDTSDIQGVIEIYRHISY